MVIFTLSLKAWIIVVMWFILAPVAHRYDLGPLYVCLLSSLPFLGVLSPLSILPMHMWPWDTRPGPPYDLVHNFTL